MLRKRNSFARKPTLLVTRSFTVKTKCRGNGWTRRLRPLARRRRRPRPHDKERQPQPRKCARAKRRNAPPRKTHAVLKLKSAPRRDRSRKPRDVWPLRTLRRNRSRRAKHKRRPPALRSSNSVPRLRKPNWNCHTRSFTRPTTGESRTSLSKKARWSRRVNR